MKLQAEKSKIKVRITDYEKKDFILNITEAERSARESKWKGGYFRVSFMMHASTGVRSYLGGIILLAVLRLQLFNSYELHS